MTFLIASSTVDSRAEILMVTVAISARCLFSALPEQLSSSVGMVSIARGLGIENNKHAVAKDEKDTRGRARPFYTGYEQEGEQRSYACCIEPLNCVGVNSRRFP